MSKGGIAAGVIFTAVIAGAGGLAGGVKMAQNKESEIQNEANQVAQQQLAEKDKELKEQEALTIQISADMAAAIEQKNAQISDLNTQITNLQGQLANTKTKEEYDAVAAQLTAKQTELATKTAEYNTLLSQYQELQSQKEAQDSQIEDLQAQNSELREILINKNSLVVNRVLNHTFKSAVDDEKINALHINNDGTFVIKNKAGEEVVSSTYDLEHFRLSGIAKIPAMEIDGETTPAAEIEFENDGYNFQLFGMDFYNDGVDENKALFNRLDGKTFKATIAGSTVYVRYYFASEGSQSDIVEILYTVSEGKLMSCNGQNVNWANFVIDGKYKDSDRSIADVFVEENGALTVNNILFNAGENVPLTETSQYDFLEILVGREYVFGDQKIAITSDSVVDYYENGSLVKSGTYSMAELKATGNLDVTYEGDAETTRYTFDNHDVRFENLYMNETQYTLYVNPDPYGIFDTVSSSTYQDEYGNTLQFPNRELILLTFSDGSVWSGNIDQLEGIDAVSYGFNDDKIIDVEFATDGQSCQIVYLSDYGDNSLLGNFNLGTFQIQSSGEVGGGEETPAEVPAGWNDEYNLLDTLRTLHYANDRQSLTLEFTYNDYTATIASVDGSMVMNTSVLIDGYTLTLTIDNGDGQIQQKVGTISEDGRTITFGEEEVFVSTK